MSACALLVAVLVGHDVQELLFDLRNCIGLALPARESLMNPCEVSV